MKKIFLFSFIFIAFFSCQEDVKFNNPSIEGQKDNVFWRAIDSKAVLTSGSISITGYTRNETLTLKTSSTNPGTYILGTSTSNTATYILKEDATSSITFLTGTNIGNGEIVIEEYDNVGKTVTGTFKFNAVNSNNNPLGGPLLNFQYGKFYKVPVK